MSFPYLDFAGFLSRTVLPVDDVTWVENRQPGFVVQRIASWSSYVNSRLRKRYGNAANIGNHLPLGQVPPALVPAGTLPPAVSLSGRSVLGSSKFTIRIGTGGPLGTATFDWTGNGKNPFITNVTTAPTVVLGSTGLTANFSQGTYSTDNVYASDTCVLETVLSALTILVTNDVIRKRGPNAQDPYWQDAKDEAKRILDELKEIADGVDGLWDLPLSEDLDSAVTTGGVLGYAEQSPYVWQDLQARQGRMDDGRGRGS